MGWESDLQDRLEAAHLPILAVYGPERVEFTRMLNRREGMLYRKLLHGQHSPLTPRMTEILSLAAGGLTNEQIAKQLGLRPQTVKNYMVRIYEQLGTTNRAGAVYLAQSKGLFE